MQYHLGGRWIALWRHSNKLDGYREWPLVKDYQPALFPTRRAARNYIKERYGYLRDRPDLRAEPHGWRMPIAVRASVTVEW